MKIGEYEVTAISKEAVKVGFQIVTADHARAALKLMDDYEDPNFKIVQRISYYQDKFLEFSILHTCTGWVSVDIEGSGQPRTNYNHKAMDFCLTVENARKLRDFLNKATI